MKMQRTYGLHFKTSLFWAAALVSVLLLTGCGNADTAGTQARSDLTSDHVRGLYSGMNRNDIEDLLGTSDKSLAEHESIEVYSLSDGTTAVLRYRDDTLMGAYLRDKNNIETPLFGNEGTNTNNTNGTNNSDMNGTNGLNDSNMTGINGTNDTNSSLSNDMTGGNTDNTSESQYNDQ
ncbi:MAG: hypothetical protein SO181_10780 [Frisingicoccus sp.]|uniref:hypothetical protein n=1 Tax=Frisingicoccus sp. TaxID=1918627 RepID=UPI00261E3D01|nr:hypothetical protein [Frisingicoccus sp.]MDD6231506.1 hypothetical protein [Frisingicoccus sp.]MDY4835607.1 hypothetical protein [Frisingicoccus sp.]